MYVTHRFWERFSKDDAVAKRKLLEEMRITVYEPRSSKNRNYLTEGRLGQASRDLGLSLTKDRLSRSGRLIFHRDKGGNFHFVDYDWNHTSVDELEANTKSGLKEILRNEEYRHDLAEWLAREGSGWRAGIQLQTSGNRETFVEELGDEWVRFLDSEQRQLSDQLFEELVSGTAPELTLIIGAAGTGKTMVLLDLAWRLIRDAGIEVKLDLPSGVRDYLAKSEDDYWFQRATKGKITLLDDPVSFERLELELSKTRKEGSVLVVSIDPTQWVHKRSRDQLWRLLLWDTVRKVELRTAYRQGGAVGKPVLELISNFYKTASMFADPLKVAEDLAKAKEWEDLCLRGAIHVDDSGFFVIHEVDGPDYLRAAIRQELEQVVSFETYRRWPKLLIGSSQFGIPEVVAAELELKANQSGLRYKVFTYDQVERIRGTEFESVILFLSRQQYQNIMRGPTGLGKLDYTKLTQPLTFLTRAENRLAVFVLPSNIDLGPV